MGAAGGACGIAQLRMQQERRGVRAGVQWGRENYLRAGQKPNKSESKTIQNINQVSDNAELALHSVLLDISTVAPGLFPALPVHLEAGHSLARNIVAHYPPH